MNGKEKILARIREALTLTAPFPGAHHGEAGHPVSEPEAASHIPDWLPRVGSTTQEQVELFRTNSAELKTDFRVLNNREAVVPELKKIATEENWKKVGYHPGELAGPVADGLGLAVCSTGGPYKVTDLESCDAGISECDALVAQTGTVVVSTRSAGGRALSVLPPHHVVIARIDQLLPDLPSAVAFVKKKYGGDYPSFISFITGPSRTGDIERILVLGAHGPKKLTVLLIAG